MPALNISELSTAQVGGTGAFDVLMRAFKAHLEQEFNQNRIRGPEYSTVYLGAMDQAMQTALAFLLQNQKQAKELELLDKQIAKVEAEIQLALQQKANLVAEGTNIPKQGALLDAQAALATQQKLNLTAEKLRTEQQTANAVLEGKVLIAQECKLRAEFDFTAAQTLKSAQELALLTQKVITEKAQTQSVGVDPDSVVGRQKGLYVAQTNGFQRDAEQKVAKALMDTWSIRRTTDEGTVADATNMLNDSTIGRAVRKMLEGVSA